MRNHWLMGNSWVSVWILVATMLGCGKPKVARPLPSIKIAIEGEATPTINRDANGDPLSVVVRVYHLKDKGEFSKLTFDLVTSGRTDQELLGADFIGRSEFVIVPGTLFRETADLSPGTKYLGVVAFFRKPDPNYWRYLVSVEQLNLTRSNKKDWQGKKLPLFSFKIQDCFMTLNYSKPEFIPGQPQNAKPECGGYFTYAPAPPVKELDPIPSPIKPTKPTRLPPKLVKPVFPPKPTPPTP